MNTFDMTVEGYFVAEVFAADIPHIDVREAANLSELKLKLDLI